MSRRQPPPSITAVQLLSLSWTKASRGGAAAEARARVPLALPFGAEQFHTATEPIWIESCGWGETDWSQPSSAICRAEAEACTLGAARLEHGVHETHVVFEWGERTVGAPVRGGRYSQGVEWWQAGERPGSPQHREFALAPGQSLRLRWNGRFSDEDGGRWWYQSATLNIARLSDNAVVRAHRGNFDVLLFTQREPDFQFESLARLW